MKPISQCKYLLAGIVLTLLAACQQLSDEGMTMGEEGTLKVRARSAENSEIVYPVYLYAFSDEGNCAVSQVVEKETDKIELQLSAGTYRIVAVAGLSDAYTLPSKPSVKDVILLDDVNGAETPLMIGKADVKIDEEADATLDITLSYAVSAIQVMLTNVPKEVVSVSMVLTPFYTSLSMDGVYGGDVLSLEIPCSQTQGEVWEAETVYVFPGSASETVFSVLLKKEDGTGQTYAYTWNNGPKANQPLNICGSYSGGISVGGDFVVKGWDTAVEVEFEFGGVKQSGEESEDEIELSEIPEVGTIWNGAIVADVGEADESGMDILLLSLDEWYAMTAAASGIIDSYSVNNLDDWRLPSYEEAKTLRDRFCGDRLTDLNERIMEYGYGLLRINDQERYLCDKSGGYYSFIFSQGSSITQAGTKRSYNVRLVKSCYITIEE